MQQLVMAEVPQYSLQSRDASCHEFNSSHFNVSPTLISHNTVPYKILFQGRKKFAHPSNLLSTISGAMLMKLFLILICKHFCSIYNYLVSLLFWQDVLTAITGHMTLTTQQDSNDLCPPSPCNPSPCENEGACVVVANDDDSTGRGFVCQCRPQFKGQTCGEVIDPCLKSK